MFKKILFKKMFYKFNKFAASINLKPVELDLKGSKCLCLSPHPDDETIAMGGTLALFGENFEVVLLTDGRKGIKDKTPEETVKIRQEEFKNSLAVAKIQNYSFLNIEDKKLMSNLDVLKNINFEQYDYIFLPNIIDQHPDHKAVSFLLREAINSGTKVKPDVKICMYEVWSALGLVNSFIDISEVIETKKSMINCFKSQTQQKDYVHHAIGLNQYRGMFKDKKYAESFFVMELSEFNKLCDVYN